MALPAEAWHPVTWREGTNTALCSRFAALRLRPAHRDYWLPAPRPEEWFLIEWPEDEPEPTKYWLSNLPADMDLTALVNVTKMRWRIERDYQDLKQEFGLGHYEGRGWRRFHHHATLCTAITSLSLLPAPNITPIHVYDTAGLNRSQGTIRSNGIGWCS